MKTEKQQTKISEIKSWFFEKTITDKPLARLTKKKCHILSLSGIKQGIVP